jgi:class 3 adenylate cyclase/uncharacterized PurR-regulated membrane protein YhhQ (DUF165 family)
VLAALFLTELVLLIAAVCGTHALRPRLGGAPLYALLGGLVILLFAAGTKIGTSTITSDAIKLNTLFFLTPILATVVVTYALDGTHAARWVFVAIAILYVVDTLIRYSLNYHAAHPPPGWPPLEGVHTVLEMNLRKRVASLVAILVDGVVIVVVYQFLRNRARFLPLPIDLALSLVAAMVADAFVFELLSYGTLSRIPLVEKFEVGVVAGFPLAGYLAVQLKRAGGEEKRSTFAIVDLRNKMRELEERYNYVRDSFSKYVSTDVVDRLLDDPEKIKLGGELREVTVLFADVRGYSTLSEKMDPRRVIRILNEYFGEVGEVVLEHDGMINEFEGDGILAVFGAPVDLEDHAQKAVACAREMLRKVELLNQRWVEDGTVEHFREVGLEGIGTRVGVHTGMAVAGNIGTGTRIKYAVIGDTVNTAARVEGLVKSLGESMLFTEQTRAKLPDDLDVIDKGEHMVKGREQPVRVFTVVQ